MLLWLREEKCGVIVDLISDVDEGQPALVLTVRVRMSDVEQAIRGMVCLYTTQRPGANMEGVSGSTSTCRGGPSIPFKTTLSPWPTFSQLITPGALPLQPHSQKGPLPPCAKRAFRCAVGRVPP